MDINKFNEFLILCDSLERIFLPSIKFEKVIINNHGELGLDILKKWLQAKNDLTNGGNHVS